MEYPSYYPLVDTFRSGYIDNRFYGLIYLSDKCGNILKFKGEDNGAKFYLRSLFKPIQSSILTDDKIYNHFKFDDKELAIMQGSHAGEPLHIELIKSILSKIGLNESCLLCPPIKPLNTNIYDRDEPFLSPVYNNCSGKHSMMLSCCVFNDFDINTYIEFLHPLQIKIKEKLLAYANTNDYTETRDGCLAPVYGLKIQNIINAFLNYYNDKNNFDLINAYKSNPYIIGGADNSGKRTDTKIMELNPNLISKVGAGGFIYVYNTISGEFLLLKMAQDNNKIREIIVLEALFRLKWLNKRYYDEYIRTEDNEETGKYVFNF